MPERTDRALLTSDEVRAVAQRYALVRPISMRLLGAGSRANAKARLSTPRGDFLLKRRAPHRSARPFVAFVHALHRHMDARGVPVAPLVLDREAQSAVELPTGVYELFAWMPGARWKRTPVEAESAGIAFGSMLRFAAGYAPPGAPQTVSFHAHPAREVALQAAVERACAADPDTDYAAMSALCGRLDERAVRAAQRAAAIRALPLLPVHGDLHPGNVLFLDGAVSAILDFDGAHLGWRACEVASAVLHFSNDPISRVPVEKWEAGLDIGRVRAMLAGIERGLGAPLEPAERAALPWLMIEACTLESAVPVARTGRFAHLRADRLLAFVDRKAAWIEEHADAF